MADLSTHLPFQARSYAIPTSPRVANYRLLSPAKPVAGEQYPIVLFLHGAGERGDDNLSQLKYLPEWMAGAQWRADYPCYLVAPQCPLGSYWSHRRRPPGFPVPTAEVAEVEVALGILNSLRQELPVDETRIYLTGLSMGGYGAWSLLAMEPELFAAAVPICGGGDPATAVRFKDVPIWAVHGARDSVVPVEQTRMMITALQAAGGTPRYSELPDVEHDSWTPAYLDPLGPLPWLFQQRKATD